MILVMQKLCSEDHYLPDAQMNYHIKGILTGNKPNDTLLNITQAVPASSIEHICSSASSFAPSRDNAMHLTVVKTKDGSNSSQPAERYSDGSLLDSLTSATVSVTSEDGHCSPICRLAEGDIEILTSSDISMKQRNISLSQCSSEGDATYVSVIYRDMPAKTDASSVGAVEVDGVRLLSHRAVPVDSAAMSTSDDSNQEPGNPGNDSIYESSHVISDSAMESDNTDNELVISLDGIEMGESYSDFGQRSDTVDGSLIHRMSTNHCFGAQDDERSNSSLSSLTDRFLNCESDASMRKRLFTSLSQSYPESRLSKILHAMDTELMEMDDDDLMRAIPDRLSSSCFGEIRLDKNDDDDDDELTNLAWLQDSDLLKNINPGDDLLLPIDEEMKENVATDLRKVNCKTGDGGFFCPQTRPSHAPYDPRKHINSKPPYSFSCLIFMAVEESEDKMLPVKDIYHWILKHFPYFNKAPTGWKNSVRHNLSLNKCFKKVENNHGGNMGKGSLWCVDPDYRPNLLQALRKTPYHPYHQLQMMATQPHQHHIQGITDSGLRTLPFGQSQTDRVFPNSVSPHLFPFLSRKLAQTGLRPNVIDNELHDVANTLVSLKQIGGERDCHVRETDQTSPKRYYHGMLKPQCPSAATPHPHDDHIYSTLTVVNDESVSGTSSIDNEYDFGDSDDDVSDPSNYPSDWSVDEVDGDVPEPVDNKQQSNANRSRSELRVLEEEEEEKHRGAELLLSLCYGKTCPKGNDKQSSSDRQSFAAETVRGGGKSGRHVTAKAKRRRRLTDSSKLPSGKKFSSLSSSQSSTSRTPLSSQLSHKFTLTKPRSALSKLGKLSAKSVKPVTNSSLKSVHHKRKLDTPTRKPFQRGRPADMRCAEPDFLSGSIARAIPAKLSSSNKRPPSGKKTPVVKMSNNNRTPPGERIPPGIKQSSRAKLPSIGELRTISNPASVGRPAKKSIIMTRREKAAAIAAEAAADTLSSAKSDKSIVMDGDLSSSPVKTVLRCGMRTRGKKFVMPS